MHSGEYSTAEVADLFGVGRSTVYRVSNVNATKPGQVVRAVNEVLSAVRTGTPMGHK